MKKIKKFIPARVWVALRCLVRGVPEPSPGRQDWHLGMTTMQEQAYYRVEAARLKETPGAIVDLGCWMGSTTISFAEGVRGADRPNKIYAYDLFRWESWMNEFHGKTLCDYVPGDCFLPEARRRLRDHLEVVELIQLDLSQACWEGAAIKILLVDAMKSGELTAAIAKTFFPFLASGGLLIHQDFKHYYTSWIHLLQYRLRRYFDLAASVPESPTVAFTLRGPIQAEDLEKATESKPVNEEEVNEAFRYSLSLVQQSERGEIAAAHVMHYIHQRQIDQGMKLLAKYESAKIIGSVEKKLIESQL